MDYRLVAVPDTFHPDGRVTTGLAPLTIHISNLHTKMQGIWAALSELIDEVNRESRSFTDAEAQRYRELQCGLEVAEGQLKRAMMRLREL